MQPINSKHMTIKQNKEKQFRTLTFACLQLPLAMWSIVIFPLSVQMHEKHKQISSDISKIHSFQRPNELQVVALTSGVCGAWLVEFFNHQQIFFFTAKMSL